jgi:hypothetical protein
MQRTNYNSQFEKLTVHFENQETYLPSELNDLYADKIHEALSNFTIIVEPMQKTRSGDCRFFVEVLYPSQEILYQALTQLHSTLNDKCRFYKSSQIYAMKHHPKTSGFSERRDSTIIRELKRGLSVQELEQVKSAKLKVDSVGSGLGTPNSGIKNSNAEDSKIENRNSKVEISNVEVQTSQPQISSVEAQTSQPQISDVEVQTSQPEAPEQFDVGIQTSQSLLDPVVDVYKQEVGQLKSVLKQISESLRSILGSVRQPPS